MDSKTAWYREMDRSCVWHPYTRHSAVEEEAFPIITRGDGIHLEDSEGRRYIDAISSWWSCNLGHSHPRIVDAITRQAQELQHSILGNLTHPRAIELAAALTGFFPGKGRKVLYASDGASAVEAALRVAVQYRHNIGEPERWRFASLSDGYHGDTMGAVSVGFLPHFHDPLKPMLFESFRAAAPCCASCEWGREPESCDQECFLPMAEIVEEHGSELCAVIVEPLCQGAAGMRIYTPAYLEKLGRLCKERGIVLIVDEIAMGFGRTGKMFAFEHAGIDPDIVCLGKSLTAGTLPMSAAVVKDEIFATFDDRPEDRTFYHGHTFAGNPIAAAAALECLKIYEEDGIVERAATTGRLLAERMAAFRELPGVANVRTLGMVGAVELSDGPDGERAASRVQRARKELLDRGILLRPLGSVLYLMPPLIIDREVLDSLGRTLYEVIRDLE